ncbi:abscisic acid 8'-hydroxylase 3-like isoform X2 [Wolffia australiana]
MNRTAGSVDAAYVDHGSVPALGPVVSMLLWPALLALLSVLGSKFVQALGLPFSSGPRRRRLPLPPGTMGLPYFGETFQLFSENPIDFFAQKQKKYGPVFKTHILGCPGVMISSAEGAKFVLSSRADLFKPTFPASKERMLGGQAIFFHQGPYHSLLRRLVLRAVSPEAIRHRVPGVEASALAALRSWNGRLINTFAEMKSYAFEVALVSIFAREEMSVSEELKQCYHQLERGYNSMPINLPGTLFHGAMRARRRLQRTLSEIIASRRQRGVEGNDLLGSLMDPSQALSDVQITDNVIGVIFAARDTTASVMTWVLKYLADDPKLREAVTEEQEAIRRSKREQGEESLTWADIKKMELTTRVFQETLRSASILSFTFREAVEDVEYEGYRIPKGWKVMPLFRNIHHNPDLFPEPEKFDPSRFEQRPSPIRSYRLGWEPIPARGTSLPSCRCSFSYTISPPNTDGRQRIRKAVSSFPLSPFPWTGCRSGSLSSPDPIASPDIVVA